MIYNKKIPIVTIMGHVNHGKTSLLDKIFCTKIVNSEIGNITQHLSAYHLKTKHGKITFIDTPGHKAFSIMRSKIIKITDIIILVISIDDGIMPQTIEIIKIANLFEIKIIIAINKIDKLKKNKNLINNIKKIKNKLNKYGIISEELGGKNIFLNISCKTGQGIEDLLSLILIQSEFLEFKIKNNIKTSYGTVIESHIDKNNGPIALIVINKGELYKNDNVLCGSEYGKIRKIYNKFESDFIKVNPSIPVYIIGLSNAVYSGDILKVINDKKEIEKINLNIKNKNYKIKKILKKEVEIIKNKLSIILKVDVQGSLETILNIFSKFNKKKKIKIKIIYYGLGNITEKDIELSFFSKSTIFTFNIYNDNKISKIIKLKKIKVLNFYTIYKLIEKIKKILKKLKHKDKVFIGLAEILNTYFIKKGCIAGCIIKKGLIKNNSYIEIYNNNNKKYEGKIDSLRKFKNNVKKIIIGEFGIGIKSFNKIQKGDIIKIFKKKW